jgi:predicted N-formylglutamate amidohydrolase
MAAPDALILSCEHAGNEVPRPYQRLFRGHEEILNTHEGYDIGAFALALFLKTSLRAPLFAHRVTRLLVEVNRSPWHPQVFSKFTRRLPGDAKEAILQEFYLPHRQNVENAVARRITGGFRVIHLGVHSFTPVLDGERRNAEIGLLYDPKRHRESAFCRRWYTALHALAPKLRVRRNYPYRGAADGLTTTLRRQFPPTRYLGLELEVNNALLTQAGNVHETITASLQAALHT